MFKRIIILYYYFNALLLTRLPRFFLKIRQKYRLKKIHRFASTNSSFYRTAKPDIINKKIMMDNFDTFNTKGISKKIALDVALKAEKTRKFDETIENITVGMSSGTSGNRGLFVVSEKERLAWCGNILAKMLPKAPWKKQKIALFLRADSPLYQTVRSKTLTFAFFDLLEDQKSLKEKLKAFNPDVLVAPPSQLLMLMDTCKPIRVISIAETLLSDDEKRLEKGFGQKIFQIYQALEGFIAFTCCKGSLHINEDLIYLEKEDLGNDRFIPIITDLSRKTQPIIRYRLDDVLVKRSTPCSCKINFTTIERIEGRLDDILYVKTVEGHIKPLFPDFISRKIISADDGIDHFEVIQRSIDLWEIFLSQSFREKVYNDLLAFFKDIACLAPKITFVDTPFNKERGAKLRRIKRAYENL